LGRFWLFVHILLFLLCDAGWYQNSSASVYYWAIRFGLGEVGIKTGSTLPERRHQQLAACP